VEETDALPPDQFNRLVCSYKPLAGKWKTDLLYDIIHLEGAQAIASYESDFYAGTPAVCRNNFGRGQVWYLGSRAETDFISRLAQLVCNEAELSPVFPAAEGIEAVRREKDGKEFIFVLNHNKEQTKLTIPFAARDLLTDRKFSCKEQYTLPASGVLILEKLP
jgi:beta-galactosidase